MRITVHKEPLLKGIQAVQSAVSSRASLPILANILLESSEQKLHLTATDLDVAISVTIDAEVAEQGSVTIPAKRFGDIVKELWSDDVITLEKKPGGSVKISSRKTYFNIPGIPKDDYPQVPVFESKKGMLSIEQKLLKQMLKMTQFAMSRDEARYVLNGTLFVFDGDLIRLVATDGRRLAMIEKKMSKPADDIKNVIVPTKAIQELNRNLGDDGEVEVLFKENQLQFRIGNITITSRLIDGEYPNYMQVIPKQSKEKLSIATKDFLSATRRASIFTSQDSQSIKLSLNKDRMVITKNTPDVGEAYEEIKTEYTGGDMSIGFNPTYLIDVLKNIDQDKISLELTDPEKPGMIKTEDAYTYIILPMQLN